MRTTIADNRAVASGRHGVARGGGMTALSGLALPTIDSSTISGNRATSREGALGGGVYQRSGHLVVVNSTITGNEAGGAGTGGGIGRSATGGQLQLTYSTVVGNTAPSGANVGVGPPPPGVPAAPETLLTFGSVVATPRGGGANCAGDRTTDSRGHDATDDRSCGLGAPSDLTIGDPHLGPLADNGGATLTMLPTTASPLVDAIPVEACRSDGAAGVGTDQRGVTRPQGSGCDIGAVEIAGTAAPTGPASIPLVPRFTG